MINVLWFASDKTGCGTYRCYVPALSLQDSKVVDSSFLMHDQVVQVEQVAETELRDMDVAVFQRAVGTAFLDLMRVCRTRGIATIFEMDDNLFNIPRHNPSAWFWHKKAVTRILRQQLDLADAVVVSTLPLREVIQRAMGWPTAEKIHVCMNHLHPAVWGRQVWGDTVPYQNQQLVIGWQGSATHDTDFKMALPALWKIVQEFPNVMLRFLGSLPLSMQGVIPEERFQWTKGVPMEQYPAMLRFVNFDIGIAPITNSMFNRSKSNIKWLEYSALAIPSVCSRVYPYERSITDGVTGYLAETPDEWYEKLKALILDAELRRQIGVQAQAHVWREWSHETHAPKWAQLFTHLARARRYRDRPHPETPLLEKDFV